MKAVVFHGIGSILVRNCSLNPAEILTQREAMTSAIEAYKAGMDQGQARTLG